MQPVTAESSVSLVLLALKRILLCPGHFVTMSQHMGTYMGIGYMAQEGENKTEHLN